MIYDGLSDEELARYIEKDTYTLMKCEKCGYEENVPDWVLEEFMDMARYQGKKAKKACMCMKCQRGNMYPKDK